MHRRRRMAEEGDCAQQTWLVAAAAAAGEDARDGAGNAGENWPARAERRRLRVVSARANILASSG